VATPVAAPIAVPLDVPIAEPGTSSAASPASPVPVTPPNSNQRRLELALNRPLNSTESALLKKSIVEWIGCFQEDISLSGNAISPSKRSTYTALVTFSGNSVANFDSAFSDANATASSSGIVGAISNALPDVGNVSLSILSDSPSPKADSAPQLQRGDASVSLPLSKETIAAISFGVVAFVCVIAVAVFAYLTKTKERKFPTAGPRSV
jgi:hypothetical protein